MEKSEGFRTLTFGDRSISYDTDTQTGAKNNISCVALLYALGDVSAACFPHILIEPDADLSDDSVDSGAGSDFSESEDLDVDEDEGENWKESSAKQLIKPDVLDMCHLLNFNEVTNSYTQPYLPCSWSFFRKTFNYQFES